MVHTHFSSLFFTYTNRHTKTTNTHIFYKYSICSRKRFIIALRKIISFSHLKFIVNSMTLRHIQIEFHSSPGPQDISFLLFFVCLFVRSFDVLVSIFFIYFISNLICSQRFLMSLLGCILWFIQIDVGILFLFRFIKLLT